MRCTSHHINHDIYQIKIATRKPTRYRGKHRRKEKKKRSDNVPITISGKSSLSCFDMVTPFDILSESVKPPIPKGILSMVRVVG